MDNYTTYTEQLHDWSEKGEHMWQRIKNWIIRKLGGYTEADYRDLKERMKLAKSNYDQHDKHEDVPALTTAQSEIKIDPLFGYTEANIITQAKAQTIYELGKAVYPYAHHFITPDGVYIASIEVLKGETE
mgnify:CR=1 FL=1